MLPADFYYILYDQTCTYEMLLLYYEQTDKMKHREANETLSYYRETLLQLGNDTSWPDTELMYYGVP